MSDKVVVERNKTNSTLRIIKKMIFQPEKDERFPLKSMKLLVAWKKERVANEYSQFLIKEKIRLKQKNLRFKENRTVFWINNTYIYKTKLSYGTHW